MKKQKVEENFRDKFEEFEYKSSLDESSIKDSRRIKPNSDKDNLKVVKKWGNNIYEGLGDDNRGVQLGDENHNFKLV